MPVLKHAKKKLRQDKRRTVDNLKIKELYKKLVKAAKSKPTNETMSAAFSAIDKAAKHHIIHTNKASRLKAGLAKTAAIKPEAKAEKTQKKATKAKASPSKTTKKSAKK